jgi:hypothetical protein
MYHPAAGWCPPNLRYLPTSRSRAQEGTYVLTGITFVRRACLAGTTHKLKGQAFVASLFGYRVYETDGHRANPMIDTSAVRRLILFFFFRLASLLLQATKRGG